MMLVDLHIHTNNSDGQYSTTEVLDFCKQKGLEIISITDHDTLDGYQDIDRFKKSYKGQIISGIELSFGLDGRLYDILGYNIDIDTMNNWLKQQYPLAELVAKQKYILNKMQEIYGNLAFKFDKTISVSSGRKSEAYIKMISSLISYPENIEKEPTLNQPNFYKKHHTNKNSKYYVDETYNLPSIKEVIDAIHKAGGIAILAHSAAYGFSENQLRKFIQLSIDNGIDGLELKYSSHTLDDEKIILEYANKYNLITTGGSDFHGEKIKIGIELGITLGNHKLESSDIKTLLEKINEKKDTD